MGTFEANLATFLQWLLKATLQGSLLVCLILLIKVILREKLPARWHYALWLVLLIRLALPWAPPSRISIYGLIPRSFSSHDATSGLAVPPPNEAHAGPDAIVRGSSAARTSAADQTGTSQPGQGGTAAEPSAMQPPLESSASSSELSSQASGQNHRLASFAAGVLAWVWLAGGIALAGYILIRAFGLWRAVVSERPVTDQQVLDLLEDCKMQMRVRILVGVVVTDKVQTPALFGVIRPRILLPQGLIGTFGLDELHCVFLHELAHLKRRDIYLAWLVCLLQVLHWFNPLIWYAFRRMRSDQEMAADALALATAGTDESRRYGQTIVSLVERFSRPQYMPSLAGILENPSHIERRIQMIAKFSRTPRRPLPAAALLAVLALIALTDAQTKSVPQPEGKTNSAAAKEASIAPQTSSAGKNEKVGLPAESNEFVDPKTGITFKRVKTLVGPDDVLGIDSRIGLSPNGKFLLDGHGLQIVPLEGGKPFKLADLRAADLGSWSPDGKKVAFLAPSEPSGWAVWMVHVDADTARPTTPPKKLAECPFDKWLRWTADSERIIFARHDKEADATAWWTVSIDDGTLTRITDFSSVGIPSPDGEKTAYSENPTYQGRMGGPAKPLWVKDTKGGSPRKIDDGAAPWGWAVDGKWVYCFDVWRPSFVRIADGYKVSLTAGLEVPTKVGWPIASSLHGKKVYFYCTSWDSRRVLQVVSASGGPAYELDARIGGGNKALVWSPDNQAVIIEGTWSNDNNPSLKALPLDGRTPISFRKDVSIPGSRFMSRLSPDCKNLLIAASDNEGADGPWDVWVVPVSWQEMRTTGPAVQVFKGWNTSDWGGPAHYAYWSPDGKRIALPDRGGSIYVVPATGGDPVRLTTGSEVRWLYWSPDGKMIAFVPKGATSLVQVIPSTGGEAKTVCSRVQGTPLEPMDDIHWSPDSQALIVMHDQGPVSVSVADGSTRSLVNMTTDLGKGVICAFRLSADGTTLGFLKFFFQGAHEDDQLCLLDMTSGKIDPLMPVGGNLRDYRWSPNGKWIASVAEESYRTRGGSVLWEMDVEEALAKLAK